VSEDNAPTDALGGDELGEAAGLAVHGEVAVGERLDHLRGPLGTEVGELVAVAGQARNDQHWV
jgi:hypothetical protein